MSCKQGSYDLPEVRAKQTVLMNQTHVQKKNIMEVAMY